jgi:hypothetical protein
VIAISDRIFSSLRASNLGLGQKRGGTGKKVIRLAGARATNKKVGNSLNSKERQSLIPANRFAVDYRAGKRFRSAVTRGWLLAENWLAERVGKDLGKI